MSSTVKSSMYHDVSNLRKELTIKSVLRDEMYKTHKKRLRNVTSFHFDSGWSFLMRRSRAIYIIANHFMSRIHIPYVKRGDLKITRSNFFP